MDQHHDAYGHAIEHHDKTEGFDRSEPKTGAIWGFTIGSVLVLAITIGALQQYFEKIWNDAVYEKVLAAPSPELKTVRGRDDWDLTHYMYLNKDTGQIRIPLDRAQELFMKEVAAGKPFYPGKPTVPKKEEPDTAAAPAAAEKK
ncbi:MAG: hypothetical protein JO307_02960 [Bryobacterales bacterium]|nr:hypothetical protein [Bryobacterales bacterium]MBV9400193.1 hypothetical protein [Bryobacterales bacterium]